MIAADRRHWVASTNEKEFIANGLNSELRTDGRQLLESRPISFNFQRREAECQVEICAGKTRARCVVTGEVVAPHDDRPTDGFLTFNVELSPMAAPEFEATLRPPILAVELGRIVERSIRNSLALDTESLAIIAGEKVWSIRCTIHVLNHDGNLIDAVSLAAIAGLMHFRRPEVHVSGNNVSFYSHDERTPVPLCLHHIPVCVSLCFYHQRSTDEPIVFIDPNHREEMVVDGCVTFTFNSFNELCAVHQVGGIPVSKHNILHCANLANARASELIAYLKEQAEAADATDISTRREKLRGTQYIDVSLDQAVDHTMEVELGTVTDFDVLHAPIALKSDEKVSKDVAGVDALLGRLEVAAKATEKGLEINQEARDEFNSRVKSSSREASALDELLQLGGIVKNDVKEDQEDQELEELLKMAN